MNMINSHTKPLPRLTVLSIMYSKRAIVDFYKGKTVSALKFLLAMMFVTSLVAYVPLSVGVIHAITVGLMAFQIWISVYMVYNAIRWLFARTSGTITIG
jgi:CBS domain containing-hemolysin-like protein